MVKQQVKKIIQQILAEFSQPVEDFFLTRPSQAGYGDYATSVAWQLENENPQKFAKALAKKLSKNPTFLKVEEKNGFVNFFLKNEVWQRELGEILKQEQNYGILNLGQGQVANIEFISANPTGELHVGNGRGAFFGDVLANVLEKVGYKVEREYFINDAKSSLQIQELGKTALGRGQAYLTDYLKKILIKLQPQLKKLKDEKEAGFLVAQQILKDIKDFVTQELKIKIDRWFSENELFESGQIEKALKKLPTYKKEGAVWIKTTKFGDDEDRVLIRSDGTAGYFLSDIAYHLNKAKRADLLIDIWGADHQGHVKRMEAVGKSLGFGSKLQILISQIVHIKESGLDRKMSKREGRLVPLRWLIKEVGLDAARFFYLSKALSTHMDFDISLAKQHSQQNPVYYIQYSYARSHQILAKAKPVKEFELAELSLLTNQFELDLIKKLTEYPELIEEIVTGFQKSQNYDLHKITTYAIQLSAVFHKFYEEVRVLIDDEKLCHARLALVRGYQIILESVFDLLGISAPKRM